MIGRAQRECAARSRSRAPPVARTVWVRFFFSFRAAHDQSVVMSALDDFAGGDFGDKRLTKRLLRIVEGLSPNPAASLPDAASSDGELEGTYRFLENEKVTPQGILAPHYAATTRRAKDAGLVLCAHDTTELSYSKGREGLGRLNDGGSGFFAHVALALRADDARSPLGVIGLSTHVRRDAPRKNKHTERIPPKERESYRWLESVDAVEDRLREQAAVIHLLDSEADAYLLLEHMVGQGARFVVRATHRRNVTCEGGERLPIEEALRAIEGVFERDVPLSARTALARPREKRNRNLSRDMRIARLSFAATRVTLHAPQGEQATTKSIIVNVVHVRELNVPVGAEPIDWKLYTTEPIDTPEEIARVVDFYRARWRIEELFKALKTGCAIEKRQLESMATLLNALAIFLPIACDLLTLRTIARADPTRPARDVLSTLVFLLLQRHPRTKLAADATARDAMLAVARFGGHIKNNGEPGWLVLGRGYEKVLSLAEGMALEMRFSEETAINP